MSTTEKDFVDHIKKGLDASVDNLDGATRSRLSQIRTRALDQHGRKPKTFRNWLWAGSALAPALALGLVIFFGLPGQHSPEQQAVQVTSSSPVAPPAAVQHTASLSGSGPLDNDELKLLMSEEELEMLTDLDFLTWLTSDNEVGG